MNKKYIFVLALVALFMFQSCVSDKAQRNVEMNKIQAKKTPPTQAELKAASVAYFAGGCFWCMEKPFDHVDGVLDTYSGYMGGGTKNPSYKQVSAGTTGHAEVVRVRYDSNKVNYQQLLDVYWKNVDMFDAGGQFCDRGSQYRSAIFINNAQENQLANSSLKRLQQKAPNMPIKTTIETAGDFYQAESYHQDYYLRNPVRYKYYRSSCGRDARLAEIDAIIAK